jgi:hypothetical protein
MNLIRKINAAPMTCTVFRDILRPRSRMERLHKSRSRQIHFIARRSHTMKIQTNIKAGCGENKLPEYTVIKPR